MPITRELLAEFPSRGAAGAGACSRGSFAAVVMREAGIVGFHVQEVLGRNSFWTAGRWGAAVTPGDLAIELTNGVTDTDCKTNRRDVSRPRAVS